MDPFLLMVLVIVVAVVFEYINGFHDAANAIATIVATRVLKPLHAVLWAAFFNFVAAFVLHSEIEVAPRRVFAHSGGEVVLW